MCHKAVFIPDVGIDADHVGVLHSTDDKAAFIAWAQAEHAKLWADERDCYYEPWIQGLGALCGYEAGNLTAVLPWEYGVLVLQ